MNEAGIEGKKEINQNNPDLIKGGLLNVLRNLLSLGRKSQISLLTFAILLMLIAWLPMAILDAIYTTSPDTSEIVSFREDFFVHVRFLIVIPFLILFVKPVNKSFLLFTKNTEKLVDNNHRKEYEKLLKRSKSLIQSTIPDIIFLLLIYSSLFTEMDDLSLYDTNREYFLIDSNHITPTGWYYLIISLPLLQLILFRWFWHWLVWVYITYKLARTIKLKTDPLHADQMAGLEYVSITPFSFSPTLLAPSAILSAMIGMNIIYSGASVTDYLLQIVSYVVILPLILYMPLTLYIPLIFRAKIYGITKFGDLIREHDILYDEKWMNKEKVKSDLLGSVDHSSLADINGSYQSVQGMKLIPMTLRVLVASILICLLPYIPLIFTYYTVSELFSLLITNVFGS